MFKKVLVPLDGTPQAAAALPLARTIARTTQGSLVLLRATHKADRSGEVERYLQAVVHELQDMPAEYVVRRGTPAREIVGVARDLNADLIVMATHGRTGIERILAGSVAEGVLQHSPVPLVLVRPGGKRVTQLKTLLVPTDGTAGAALALGSAVGLARASDARVVLVEAIEAIPMWVYGSEYGVAPTYIDPEWEDEALSAANAYIRGLVARLQADGITANGEALQGRPVATIEQMADHMDADLIVMSTHAYTGPVRTVLGSTADALVRTANRPVLLVRRPGGEADEATAEVTDADVVRAPAG